MNSRFLASFLAPVILQFVYNSHASYFIYSNRKRAITERDVLSNACGAT